MKQLEESGIIRELIYSRLTSGDVWARGKVFKMRPSPLVYEMLPCMLLYTGDCQNSRMTYQGVLSGEATGQVSHTIDIVHIVPVSRQSCEDVEPFFDARYLEIRTALTSEGFLGVSNNKDFLWLGTTEVMGFESITVQVDIERQAFLRRVNIRTEFEPIPRSSFGEDMFKRFEVVFDNVQKSSYLAQINN